MQFIVLAWALSATLAGQAPRPVTLVPALRPLLVPATAPVR
jgi:hypothetical protein